MSAKLVVIEGRSEGSDFPLEDQAIVEVGKSPQADFRLDDNDIVGVHLKIYRENQAYHVFDLSGRGFLVNGRRRLKHELSDEDLITIGNSTIRYEQHSSQPEAESAPDTPSEVGSSTEHGVDDEDLAFMSQVNATPTPGKRPGPDGKPKIELTAIKGTDAGKVFDLRNRPMCVLGRGMATDITLWDIRASRIHCRIEGQNSRYVVSDMNSSNGTYVNGVRIKKPVILKSGDLIKVGSTLLQFAQVD